MTNLIAVIDPFVKSPAINCFNGLVKILNQPLSYHQPSQFGIESLRFDRTKIKAYVVLGSASHIYEKLPWQVDLSAFLLEELKDKKPVLGCCFGHQLICHAFGSKVDYYQDENTKLLGKRCITIEKDFWNFKQGELFELAVSHRQVVSELGHGLIAVGSGLKNDIVVHEKYPFFGTQAHPEASDFFCRTEISVLGAEEKVKVGNDGQKLILRFFKHFNLI